MARGNLFGWALTAPVSSVGFRGFRGRVEGGPGGDELHSIVVTHGAIRLELEYNLQGRAAVVNGVPVQLPEGHDVILLDHVDQEPEVVGTLSVGGEELEPIETFIGRSPSLREFVRCDVPLPEDAFASEDPELSARFREFMQGSLDERCQMLLGQ